MGRFERVVVCVAVATVALGACGKSASEKVSDAFQSEASRAECVKVFETYRDEMPGAYRSDTTREVVVKFFTQAVLACPSRNVWDEVAKEVAPDNLQDWSSAYERGSLWRGMCDEAKKLPFTAPACKTYRG